MRVTLHHLRAEHLLRAMAAIIVEGIAPKIAGHCP
jgi:hypothetical protein